MMTGECFFLKIEFRIVYGISYKDIRGWHALDTIICIDLKWRDCNTIPYINTFITLTESPRDLGFQDGAVNEIAC